MESKSEWLQIEVSDVRTFVRDVLRETHREDLFTALDEENLTDHTLVAINELAELMGGGVELEQNATSDKQVHALEVLLNRKYHINVKRIAWKSLIASVPIIANLIRAQADPLGYLSVGGSVLSVIEIVRDNVKKMSPEEVTLYLAVQAVTKQLQKPASPEDVASYLSSEVKSEPQWDIHQVRENLASLSSIKKVLEESDGRYRVLI